MSALQWIGVGLGVVALLGGLVACRSTAEAPPGRSVAFEPLTAGVDGGLREAGVRVATTAEELSVLRAQITGRSVVARQSDDVDLAEWVVVAVALGERPTAGYGLEVVDVRSDGEVLVVYAAELAPPAGAMTAQVVTAPWQVIAVEREGYGGDARLELLPSPAPTVE